MTETRLTKLDISLQARHVYKYLCNVTQERVTKPALCAFQYNKDFVAVCFSNQVIKYFIDVFCSMLSCT